MSTSTNLTDWARIADRKTPVHPEHDRYEFRGRLRDPREAHTPPLIDTRQAPQADPFTLRAIRADYLDVLDGDLIETFLANHAGRFYCNRCLSDELLVFSATQVDQITRRLRSIPPYRHGTMICTRCRTDRLCIAYGPEPPLPDNVEPDLHP